MSDIRGLGEEVLDEVIVKKVLRSLTPKYDTKVSAIEEARELKTFSMDELFGSLFSYETRAMSVEPSKREVSFNITKKGKEEVAHEEVEEDLDVVVVNFVRKLKRGSGKYKGKLPFKCFNCGKIVHFASKFSYGEKDEDGKKAMKSFGKEKMKNSYKPRKRSFRNKSSLYTFEDVASDEEIFSED